MEKKASISEDDVQIIDNQDKRAEMDETSAKAETSTKNHWLMAFIQEIKSKPREFNMEYI